MTSLLPPLSLSRAEAGLRRSPPAIGGSVRETEVIHGFRGSRRSRRWVLWSREWTGSSAVSFAADGELREQSGFGATVVLDQNRVVGMVYGRMRGLLVERTESGRPWWCRIGRGSGGGCSCRRWGRRPPPGRLAAMGELGEHSKASCVLGEARGPPFIARRGRFRGGRISSLANLLSVACRATWRGWG